MSHVFQVTIDCSDPHGLADWWAETLEWQVEPQDATFIRSMIDQGFANESDTVEHRGNLVWKTATAMRPAADDADGPRVLFQEVPEPKTVKNRIHLDVRPVGDVDLDAFRASLEARGATVLSTGQQGPHTWVTMADPEGNEFCV